jgi:hypothetical protein
MIADLLRREAEALVGVTKREPLEAPPFQDPASKGKN